MAIQALESIDGEVTRTSFLAAMKAMTFEDPLMLAAVEFTEPGPNRTPRGSRT